MVTDGICVGPDTNHTGLFSTSYTPLMLSFVKQYLSESIFPDTWTPLPDKTLLVLAAICSAVM